MRNPSEVAISQKSAAPSSHNPDPVIRGLLPDEELKAFEDVERAIYAELAPATYFERRLALNVAHIEWEIDRHRRLIASTLRSAFNEKAAAIYARDKPEKGIEFKTRDEKWVNFTKALNSDDADDRRRAEVILEKYDVTRPELTASAYMTQSGMISYHEGRIADLERRRRSLLADFDALKARKKPAPIIDADVVE